MTPMNKNPATHLVSYLLLLTIVLLCGCSTNVTVNGDYPSALTRKQQWNAESTHHEVQADLQQPEEP